MTKEFLVVYEAGPKNFSAFAPDIPGCYALGDTLDLTRERFLGAAKAHLDWMASDHDPIPEPVTSTFNFAREVEGETGRYAVEWLPIPMPTAEPGRNGSEFRNSSLTHTTERFHVLADAVLGTVPDDALKKVQKKSYIVLERQLGKSPLNKNAVSILREGIDFMVPDWALEAEARRRGLRTERFERFAWPRLRFLDLSVTDVESNADYFQRLTLTAKSQSEKLQTAF
jgi:predicted RNase H-like HicB family nuclease